MTVVAGTGLVATGFDPGQAGWIEFDGDRIVGLGSGTRAGAIDLDDTVLVPGFVDLQVNGIGPVDFAIADPARWRSALLAQARHGVTGCCPTLVSAPLDSYAEPLTVAVTVAASPADEAGGASVLGVHLEGPFLGGAPGAHVVEYLRPVDTRWLTAVLDRFPGLIRIVTLAPEADPGLAGTRALHAAGVVVAIGHTTAGYDDVRAAADAGASLVTHLFNGMGPFNHRRPGVVGAALDDARLTPSIIADLVHVHPAAVRIAIRAKRSVALITDAVAVGAGTAGAGAAGTGTAGAVTMEERDGAARLADGTLAGAVVPMDQAVRNVVALGFPLERAVELASTVPCEILGDAERGRLEPGRRADIVALDRTTLAVRSVWIGGRPVPLA
jgi:N-acetylglucosamine-6-phosphate deacetylase